MPHGDIIDKVCCLGSKALPLEHDQERSVFSDGPPLESNCMGLSIPVNGKAQAMASSTMYHYCVWFHHSKQTHVLRFYSILENMVARRRLYRASLISM
jgi:hypothetical protein